MEIKGKVENVIYRNSENGYTVVELLCGTQKIVATGKFPAIGFGETLELVGDFKFNKNYGQQFVAESAIIKKPSDTLSIIKYLSSGLIYGVGEVTATNIVKMFGERTLDVIENEPKLLSKVRGISEKKANEIHLSYNEIKRVQDTVMLLQNYDISINLALKIIDKFKQKTKDVLFSNPYILIEEIDGVGFKTADKIALKLGFKIDSDVRIKAGIVYALSEIAEKQGSTVALLENVKTLAIQILELDESFDGAFESALADLEIDGQVKKITFEENEALAISKYYYMESFIAKKLVSLNESSLPSSCGTEAEVEQFEILNGIKLHENQKQAVLAGTSEGVVIITGGPGTGKTTIVKGILKILKNRKLKCLLMAPTGRAAKRLEESTGEPSSTIHRALEANFRGEGHGFLKNENNPLDADAVIVDEVSMLDCQLTFSLLKALNFGTRLILVGDKDQLPSVGAGNVLADIIASKKFKVVELTQIFRQDSDSMIVVNAHKINNSEMPDLRLKSSDFFYSSTFEPTEVANEIISLICERIPKYFKDISSDDIQVIAPMKSGFAGVDNLNVLIQDKLNPAMPGKQQIELSKRVFRVSDRVMQIVNNYDRQWEKINEFGYATFGEGVFNGDMGKVEEINREIGEIYVLFDDGRRATYSYAELDEIVLSYAITIHKSQGSEFPVVIIPIMGGSPLLMNKNLLYTAVTRAKKAVILIGKSSNIYFMVKNKNNVTRNTLLKNFLEKENIFSN